MDRVENATKLHELGYNCSQAVACTFADKVNMDAEDLFKIMEAFGSGMGGLQGTCGAITGAVAILSLMNSVGSSDTTNKKNTYKLSKEMVARFAEKNGAIACKDLKGIETGKVLRSCPDCINDAVEILEAMLAEM